MLDDVAEHIRAQAAARCDATGAPGYLAGVYHDGEEVVVAHGLANIVTEAPMREETGFLLGSVTKLLTTTLLLRFVERGLVDLEERVVRYLPEFTLTAPDAAAEIRVRNLVTHTDGIDADLFFPTPDVRGRRALESYVAQLGTQCGVLFEPGEYVSYSNPAFLVLGRLLEVVTGETFHDLLVREIYGEVGMLDSCVSAEQAILRSTAVGHFPAPDGETRRTGMFMLPENWSSAGGTPIVTIHDLLAFARTHLDGGSSPSGRRVLSRESVERMQTRTVDMGTPNCAPFGLGWPLVPFGETTVLWHGGGSPGGTSALAVVPTHDLALAVFANDPRGGALHDELLLWLLRDHLKLDVPDVVTEAEPVADLSRYVGTYRSNQLRVDVRLVDGKLEQEYVLEPTDPTQDRVLSEFSGGLFPAPPQKLTPIRENLFAPEGLPLETFTTVRGRHGLVSFHGGEGGRPAYRGMGGRLTRRREAP